MKILIDNRDLPYSIDTYGMFNGENVEEGEPEFYLEEYGLPVEDYDMDYDHEAIVKDFAEYSIFFIKQGLQFEKPIIVRDITLEKTRSPQFYNYTTDSYRAEWDIDTDKLQEFIEDHIVEWNDWFIDSRWSNDNFAYDRESEYSEETWWVIKLEFYLRQVYELDDYNMSMWEVENEVYSQNSQPTDEMKAKLKQLQEEN